MRARLTRAVASGLVALASAAGCSRAQVTTAPMSSASTPDAGTVTPPASAAAVTASPSSSPSVVGGELKISSEIVFEVRPLGGPGTMGPTVLSPKSDRALDELRAYLASHPDATPLRIECSVNPARMSSNPDARWPAGLALQIARRLVEQGVDCKRLEAVGWLDRDLDTPGERVRFFSGSGAPRPPEKHARLDACGR